MQNLNYLELEQEISRLTTVIATRSTSIGQDFILDLRSRFTLHQVAGMMLVSLARLVWLDSLSFCWAVEHLISADLMHEIRGITSISVYKRLISEGLLPGQDFSMDANGGLLLNDRAKASVLG